MGRLWAAVALTAYLGASGCASPPPPRSLHPAVDPRLARLSELVSCEDHAAEMFAAPCRGEDLVEVAKNLYGKMLSAGLGLESLDLADPEVGKRLLNPFPYVVSSDSLLRRHTASEPSLALFYARCLRACDMPVGLAVRESPPSVDILVPTPHKVNQYADVEVLGRKWVAVSFRYFDRDTFERAAQSGRDRFSRTRLFAGGGAGGVRIPDAYPSIVVIEPRAYAGKK